MSLPAYRFQHAIGESLILTGPLPHFRVISRSLGGFSEVYILESTEQERRGRIVLKTPRIDSPLGGTAISSFEEEARLWSTFPTHPSILPCLSVERISNRPYAVIKYVDGTDCEHFFMSGNAPLDLQLNVLFQIVQALTLLEQQIAGFSHGDIKPSNILLEIVSSGQDVTDRIAAFITDFGLSRAFTRTAVDFTGDTRYLAPEVFRGDFYSWKAADMYSLGATAVQILSEQPIERLLDSDGYVEPKRLLLEREELRQMDRFVSSRLITLLCNLVQEQPQSRPTSFTEVSSELQNIMETTGIHLVSKQLNILDAKNASFIQAIESDVIVRYLVTYRDFSEQNATILRLEQSEGSRFVKLGNTDAAIAIGHKLVEKHPWFPLGYALLGGAYTVKQDYKMAATNYMQGIKAYDNDTPIKDSDPFGYAEMCYSLSQILHNDQRLEGRQAAVALAMRATELLPLHPIALMTLGRAFLSVHEYEKGLEILERAYKMFPSEIVLRAHLALGRCLQNTNPPKSVGAACAQLGLSDEETAYVQHKIEQIVTWLGTDSL